MSPFPLENMVFLVTSRSFFLLYSLSFSIQNAAVLHKTAASKAEHLLKYIVSLLEDPSLPVKTQSRTLDTLHVTPQGLIAFISQQSRMQRNAFGSLSIVHGFPFFQVHAVMKLSCLR